MQVLRGSYLQKEALILIAIVDYGMGNLGSVEKAFLYLNQDVVITCDAKIIEISDIVVLPGVGAFKDAMYKLNSSGLASVLRSVIAENKPFLGICLGLQMLFEYSEEGDCETRGLGIFSGGIKKFPQMDNLKVPHMGWNSVQTCKNGEGTRCVIDTNSFFYFVHSYYLEANDRDIVIGTTNYGITFDSIIQSKNLVATQFHPEKSGEIGMRLLSNFIESTKNKPIIKE
jgi:imidazole glycerol-phosphate synthase subunit HisH